MADENYKCVLLCERPTQAPAASAASGLPPFKPTVNVKSLEPLGLNPAKKDSLSVSANPLGTSSNGDETQLEGGTQPPANPAALRSASAQHTSNSAGRQEGNHADKQHNHDWREQSAAFTEFNEKLRTTILAGGDVAAFWKAAKKKDERPAALPQTATAWPSTTEESPMTAVEPRAQERASRGSQPGNGAAVSAERAAEEQPSKTSSPEIHATSTSRSSTAAAAVTTATATATSTIQEPEVLPEPSKLKQTAAGAESLPERGTFETGASDSGTSKGNSGSLKSCFGSKAKSRTRKPKPMWAMTEEELHAQEERELLEFAKRLDFSYFVKKLEDVPPVQAPEVAAPQQETGVDDAQETNGNEGTAAAVTEPAAHGTSTPGGTAVRASETSSGSTYSRPSASSIPGLTGMMLEQDGFYTTPNFPTPPPGLVWDVNRVAEEYLRVNPDARNIHSLASLKALVAKVAVQNSVA